MRISQNQEQDLCQMFVEKFSIFQAGFEITDVVDTNKIIPEWRGYRKVCEHASRLRPIATGLESYASIASRRVAAFFEKKIKRLGYVVGTSGFEPPTPASRTLCSTRLSHVPTQGFLMPFSCACQSQI